MTYPLTGPLPAAQAERAHGNPDGPWLPAILYGDGWERLITYRRSQNHSEFPRLAEYVWLAEIQNPRWPEESPHQQKYVAGWGFTPYLAYMHLRDWR